MGTMNIYYVHKQIAVKAHLLCLEVIGKGPMVSITSTTVMYGSARCE